MRSSTAAASGSPPLARGTVNLLDSIPAADGITPACAGNSRRIRQHVPFCPDHPRLRGEQSPAHAALCSVLGSPPLARGTDGKPFVLLPWERITPACAGNSALCRILPPARRDHPRLRGEQVLARRVGIGRVGSPPLARGTVIFSPCHSNGAGITPACAGNRGSLRRLVSAAEDHPRLRGEQTKKRLVVSCILQYRFSFFNQFFVDMFC